MRKLILLVVGLLVLAVGWYVWLAWQAGELRELEPIPLACESISGVVGAEDIVVDPVTGTAMLSSYDRRAALAGEPVQGAIYAWSPDGGLRSLTSDFPRELYPHGISLWRSDEGEARLFVVNHAPTGDRVEIFSWDGDRLSLVESIADDSLHSLNDLAGVGPDSFYATNDHGARGSVGRALEDYLRLRRGTVVYWDGRRATQVADGIGYANGIAVSAEGDRLYVASPTRGTIHLFERREQSGALEPRGTIEIGSGVDNITVADDGELWVGAHPKLLSFVAHSRDETKPSPSEVWRIDPADGNSAEVVWRDSGEQLSGISVAVPWEGRLLLGSVFEPHFLVCQVG